jgi:myo-inositol 2-dehydrogenase/D-chiro-inositol 1-dehydrogenase
VINDVASEISIHRCKVIYEFDQRVEVLGSKGMVQAHNNTSDNDVCFNADGVHSAKPLYFFLECYMKSFIAELKDFAQSIWESAAPSVTGVDGRIPVVIGMAARKSYLENRLIKLSEITVLVHQPA